MTFEEKIYTLFFIFLAFIITIFIGTKLFSLDIFYLAFLFFGIPIIVTSIVFWYDLINSFFS